MAIASRLRTIFSSSPCFVSKIFLNLLISLFVIFVLSFQNHPTGRFTKNDYEVAMIYPMDERRCKTDFHRRYQLLVQVTILESYYRGARIHALLTHDSPHDVVRHPPDRLTAIHRMPTQHFSFSDLKTITQNSKIATSTGKIIVQRVVISF